MGQAFGGSVLEQGILKLIPQKIISKSGFLSIDGNQSSREH